MSLKKVIGRVKRADKISNSFNLHNKFDYTKRDNTRLNVIGLMMPKLAENQSFDQAIVEFISSSNASKLTRRLRKKYGGSKKFWSYLFILSTGFNRGRLPREGTKYRTMRFLNTAKAKKLWYGKS